MSVVCIVTGVTVLAIVGYPIGIKLIADAVVSGSPSSVGIATGIGVAAGFYSLAWASGILATVENISLADRVGLLVSRRLAETVGRVATIDHFEQESYLQQVELLLESRKDLAQGPRHAINLVQAALRLVAIIAVMVSIHWLLGGLLVVALVPMGAMRTAEARQRKASERTVGDLRLANELFGLMTSAASAKELRVFGLMPELLRRHEAAVARIRRVSFAVASRTAVWTGLGWIVVGGSIVGGVALVSTLVLRGNASVGELLMMVVLMRLVQRQVVGIAYTVGNLAGIVTGLDRLFWLENYSARARPSNQTQRRVPERLARGIVLKGLSFKYPGAADWSLQDIAVELPTGALIAIVGENGAGKTTLAKLLLGLYQPTAGAILVDGLDLRHLDIGTWQERSSAVFQDNTAFEFRMRQSIGIGDLGHIEDEEAVLGALQRARAEDVYAKLPEGLDTQLGQSFSGGVELSTGQWQKVALARAVMRMRPLLLVLDEPGSGLDAEAEHVLFEHYQSVLRDVRDEVGMVSVLISHQFAAVRAVDLILVLDQGRLVEFGRHDQLMEHGGLYARLYGLHARAYS